MCMYKLTREEYQFISSWFFLIVFNDEKRGSEGIDNTENVIDVINVTKRYKCV